MENGWQRVIEAIKKKSQTVALDQMDMVGQIRMVILGIDRSRQHWDMFWGIENEKWGEVLNIW